MFDSQCHKAHTICPPYQAPGNIEKRHTQGIRPVRLYALCVFIRSPEIPTTPTIAETRRAKETRRSARKIWTWTNPPSILILIHILTTDEPRRRTSRAHACERTYQRSRGRGSRSRRRHWRASGWPCTRATHQSRVGGIDQQRSRCAPADSGGSSSQPRIRMPGRH